MDDSEGATPACAFRRLLRRHRALAVLIGVLALAIAAGASAWATSYTMQLSHDSAVRAARAALVELDDAAREQLAAERALTAAIVSGTTVSTAGRRLADLAADDEAQPLRDALTELDAVLEQAHALQRSESAGTEGPPRHPDPAWSTEELVAFRVEVAEAARALTTRAQALRGATDAIAAAADMAERAASAVVP